MRAAMLLGSLRRSLRAGLLASALVAGPALASDATPAAPFQLAPADLRTLDAIVGDARVVVFGEDSHGMQAVHEAVPQMFEHLVVAKGVRLFVFESSWGLEDALAGFMASDRTSVEGDETFFLNAFNSKPIVEMLVWIRGWNRTHPRDQIRLAGFQPEQPITDIQAIRAIVARALPAQAPSVETALGRCLGGVAEPKTNIELIGALWKKRRTEKKPSFTAEEREACLSGLAGVDRLLRASQARLVARTSRPQFEEALLHVESLDTFVRVLCAIVDEQMFDHPSPQRQADLTTLGYLEGDRVRFKIFEGLRRTRYGDAKAFFWMHNWHAEKHAARTSMRLSSATGSEEHVMPDLESRMESVGTRLARRYGDRLKTIGNLVPCGATCAEPADSLEPAFAARFGDHAAIVDFSDPRSVGDLPIHRVGSIFANHHVGAFGDVVLADQFDGVLYIPKTDKVH